MTDGPLTEAAGEARWRDDTPAVIDLAAEDRGGALSIIEVTDDGARMPFVLTPGGLETVVRAMSVPAAERRLPGRVHEPPDPGAARARQVEVTDA